MFDASITTCHVQPADTLRISGQDRVDLLHRLSTQDLRPLAKVGAVRQTLFVTHQGKLVDWTSLYAFEDYLWLLASPGRASVMAAWIAKYTIMEDVTCADISADTALMVLVGPDAVRHAGLSAAPPEGAWVASAGFVWSLGPTGWLRGIGPASQAASWQARCVAAGAVPADAAGMRWLRLQAGIPAADQEYVEQVNPLELRLTQHAVGWNKGCYIGQEVISRLDSYDKVARLLMGFTCPKVLSADGVYKVVRDDKPLGRVTSHAAHDGTSIGLALVKREAATPGPVELVRDDTRIGATLVERPFFL